MAQKFIPPVNQLNSITPRKSRRIFSDRQNQSVLRQSKRLIRDAYSPDAFEQVGTMKAVVLEIVSKFENSADTRWKYEKTLTFADQGKPTPFAEIRVRVPELHAHLPEPSSPDDFAHIDKHPIVLLFQSSDGSIPEVGDIVDVEFADKNNFKDGFITSVVTKGSQNSTPAIDIPKSTSDSFNCAVPPLNSAQAGGDTQGATSSTISGDPSQESSEIGVEFAKEMLNNDLLTNYFVSLDSFNTLTEFNNYSQTIPIIKEKNVQNISFQVSSGKDFLQDLVRLNKVAMFLKDYNIGVYLWASVDSDDYVPSISYMLDLVKQVQADGYFINPQGEWNEEQSIDSCLRMTSNAREIGILSGLLLTDPESSFTHTDDFDIKYILRNHLDNYEDTKFKLPSVGGTTYGYGLYHLNGYNFLPTNSDPCLGGTRTPDILRREMNASIVNASYTEKYGFFDYSLLSMDYVEAIKEKVETLEGLIAQNIEARRLSRDQLSISSNLPDEKEQPTFNSSSGGTQDITQSSPPSNNYSAGSQCSPSAGGSSPNISNVSSVSSLEDGMFRFSDIVGRENLLWTTNPGRILTQAHVEFLNKLAQKVYQKIPLTDPIFTGTDAKKLRITDAVRTPEKQVELMWGKRLKKTAAQVKELYSNAWWAKKVVDLYPYTTGAILTTDSLYAQSLSHPNFSKAVDVVKSRIAQGSTKGGHLYGNGVDIGTKYHLHIEGLKSYAEQSVSEATMNRSRFVQVVTEACRELGAGFKVEDYEEHIHITFPT